MNRLRAAVTIAVVVSGICLVARATDAVHAAPVSDPASSAALRAHGVELGYNLDYDEALAAFRQATAADPGDPAPYRLMAATMWIRLLFERGAITVDDYLGEAQSSVTREPPPPELDALFHECIDRAMALAEARLREAPRSADAHYQVGAAAAFAATYRGTVSGHVLSGFRPARRAYDEHERVMALDPQRKDAGLIVGLYRYAVSTLSAPWRVMARIAGFGGGRERGLHLVEEAAAYPSDVQTNARFMLVLMYNRESRYADALRVIEALQQKYPRNRLLWLEAGSTALRAGRPTQARLAIEDGLAKLSHDTRPRAYGENARWRLAHGTALVALEDVQLAERELRAALTGEARDWVRGRAHTELGKIADLAGDRARAIAEYGLGIRFCQADNDPDGSNEAKRLMTTGRLLAGSRPVGRLSR